MNAYKANHGEHESYYMQVNEMYREDPDLGSSFKQKMYGDSVTNNRHGVTKLHIRSMTTGTNYGMKFAMILIFADDPYPYAKGSSGIQP